MITAVQTDRLDLMQSWSDADKTQAGRFTLPISVQNGAAGSSAIYFEVEPGQHCGMHTHSAEEIALLLGGEAEVVIGGEKVRAYSGGLVLIPTMVSHDVFNVGDKVVKVVGFFASAAVLTNFEKPLQPLGTATFVLGAPEPQPAERG